MTPAEKIRETLEWLKNWHERHVRASGLEPGCLEHITCQECRKLSEAVAALEGLEAGVRKIAILDCQKALIPIIGHDEIYTDAFNRWVQEELAALRQKESGER